VNKLLIYLKCEDILLKILNKDFRRLCIMSNRYEDVPQDVIDILLEVRREYFPELRNAKIKVLFDTKKRSSGGKLTLGRMQKTNDLLRHLTTGEAEDEEGYDYIMYLDKAAFTNITRDDKIRLVRHELRHCHFDLEANSNPYKLVGHSVEDFYEEIELNQDEPRWGERVVAVAESVYNQDD
jgi:predicted metallopeptidase